MPSNTPMVTTQCPHPVGTESSPCHRFTCGTLLSRAEGWRESEGDRTPTLAQCPVQVAGQLTERRQLSVLRRSCEPVGNHRAPRRRRLVRVEHRVAAQGVVEE